MAFFIDYRNIAMTFIKEKSKKKKEKKKKARMWIAVSNLYTFVYTEWGIIYVHATYCHTLGK